MKKLFLAILLFSAIGLFALDNFQTVKIKQIRFNDATELTISGGAVTMTQTYHTIDTESDAASDDLTTITATNAVAGTVCYFKQANASRAIVFKNGTGNIITGADDYTMENGDACMFVYDGSNWLLGGGGGGGISSGGSSTDENFPIWDGTDGKTLKDSNISGADDNINIPTGKTYKINSVDILSATTLGSTVVTSSLTATGIITTGGLGTGATLGGVTMSLGSDATGDIYYRDATGVLARLAAGADGAMLSYSGGLLVAAVPDDCNTDSEFVDGNLVAGVLTCVHNLNEQYCVGEILDNDGKTINAAINYVDADTWTADLSSLGTLTGTWRAKSTKGGTSTGGGGGASIEVAVLTDETSANTAGTQMTSGGWNTKVLNTEQFNGITSCTLSSNQITLPAGNYKISGWAIFYTTDASKLRLRNVTDGATLVNGTSSYAKNGAGLPIVQNVPILGAFTITGTKTIELQYQVGTTGTPDVVSNFSENEVWTMLEITKF